MSTPHPPPHTGVPGYIQQPTTPSRPSQQPRPRPQAGPAPTGQPSRPGPSALGAQRASSPVPAPGSRVAGTAPVVLGTASHESSTQGPPSAPIPPSAQPDVEPRNPRFRRFDLPVSTTDDLPGFEVGQVVGVVLGVATRPRDLAHHPDMAFVNASVRQDAIAAMVAQALEAGAGGVIGLAFDGGRVAETVSEVTAYGTAVTVLR